MNLPIMSHASTMIKKRMGTKFAIKDSGKLVVKDRRYDIFEIVPRQIRNSKVVAYYVIAKDTETGAMLEIPENYFDWDRPWYELPPNGVEVPQYKIPRPDHQHGGPRWVYLGSKELSQHPREAKNQKDWR